jgi:hypothetical protein
VDRDDGRQGAQAVEHPELPHVPGVQHQIHAAEQREHHRRQSPAALRHVRVRDQADPGGHTLGGEIGREKRVG